MTTNLDVEITARVTTKTDRKLQRMAHELNTTKERLVTAILGASADQAICNAFNDWPDCEL